MFSLSLSAGDAKNALSRCKADNMSAGPCCNECVFFKLADPTCLIGSALIGYDRLNVLSMG